MGRGAARRRNRAHRQAFLSMEADTAQPPCCSRFLANLRSLARVGRIGTSECQLYPWGSETRKARPDEGHGHGWRGPPTRAVLKPCAASQQSPSGFPSQPLPFQGTREYRPTQPGRASLTRSAVISLRARFRTDRGFGFLVSGINIRTLPGGGSSRRIIL
jgi:hypothetical protein